MNRQVEVAGHNRKQEACTPVFGHAKSVAPMQRDCAHMTMTSPTWTLAGYGDIYNHTGCMECKAAEGGEKCNTAHVCRSNTCPEHSHNPFVTCYMTVCHPSATKTWSGVRHVRPILNNKTGMRRLYMGPTVNDVSRARASRTEKTKDVTISWEMINPLLPESTVQHKDSIFHLKYRARN